MTRVVWKFPLEPGVTILEVGGFPNVVHVGPVTPGSDAPAVWIEHMPEPAAERWGYRVVVVGTGHPVPENAQHVGSAWCGEFMWHVYELANR